MGRVVTDMGARSARRWSAGRAARPVPRDGPRRAAHARRSWPSAPGVRERYVREWLAQPGRRRLRRARSRRPTATRCPTSTRWRWPTRTARSTCSAASSIIASVWADEDRLAERFRTARASAGTSTTRASSRGTERFFRPGYRAHLVADWIPALDGVRRAADRRRQRRRRRLRPRRLDADHGPGLPEVDASSASTTTRARSRARASWPATEGVDDRVRFEVARADAYPGDGYDLVCHFDCLHDMGDPAGAARHVRETLKPRRLVDDRRALRRRLAGGQPQPGRPAVLRGVDGHLHAELAVAGGRRSASAPRPAKRAGGDPARGRASPACASRPRRRST